MKTIYYSVHTQTWFHRDKGCTYTLGHNNHALSFSEQIPFLSFRVKERHGKVGPLVGILLSESSIPHLQKRQKRYIEMINSHLQTSGGIGIVFTLNGVRANTLHGYIFSEQNEEWIETITPLPDVVYNRMKSRSEEKSETFRQFIQWLHNHRIPYFNPCFFAKWQLYELLHTNERLRPHLPATVQVHTIDDILTMLHTYKHIYMKPNAGWKGKGIFTLTYTPTEEIIFERMHERKLLSRIDELNELYKLTEYIAQQAIDSDTFHGNRYDLRILAHYNNGTHTISGIGVRLSQTQQMTTHIPNGGRKIPYRLVKERFHESLLHTIVRECGLTLSEHLGFIGEFSIDIGRGTDGQLYIYELNSKPMIFDEPEIQTHGAKRLIAVFDQLSGFASS
ncbi:YheC/YheD family endospore coat-associated protein [Thermaerobacillus caldiproteolyticus]|uniref:ATP-grasp domain-containing protein n=1 Tax=Thermaerobacillus caldiproteolyticus TaxID=247480 RepID=A0A7W0BZT5_9BACL|nr:YheC/YheD family protein [Anoxybacillus caldiproteolyticus]MBA2874781.1 hypothetical protein [Anoxybacillus caldiproteolyticus]